MTHFNPSVLGTHNYWEELYQKELQDFEEYNDPGTEWFGRNSAKRIVNWIKKCTAISQDSSIIDLGCGNGLLLLELAKNGYTCLCGVDYCQDALELAKNNFKHANVPENTAKWLHINITNQTIIQEKVEDDQQTLRVCDNLMNGEPKNCSNQCTFKVCLDKGTYDAISLCPTDNHIKRQLYKAQVQKLLSKEQGLFVITSCNWTATELQSHFSEFKCIEELPAPTFTFGGKAGKTVSTCVFQLIEP